MYTSFLVDGLQVFLFSSRHGNGDNKNGQNGNRNRGAQAGNPASPEKPGGGGARGGGVAPGGQRDPAPRPAGARRMVPGHRDRHLRRRHPPRPAPRSLSRQQGKPAMTRFALNVERTRPKE